MNEELKSIIVRQRADIAAKREAAINAAVARSYNENVTPKINDIERKKTADIAAAQQEQNARVAQINDTAAQEKAQAVAEDRQAVVISVGAEYDTILDKYDTMLADKS